MKKITLFLLLFLPYCSYAQQKSTEGPAALTLQQRLGDLDSFVEKILKDWNTPGAGLAVVYKDSVIWAKGYGYRDLEKKLPVTPNTYFKIASNTKLFTATAIGMLVEEGKLEWDKPIGQYVPALEFSTPDLNQNVTIRDMLSHRTGLARYDWIWPESKLSTQQLAQRIRYMEPLFPLRQKFVYNNMVYIGAGATIEYLSGKSWQSYLREKLLDPLGMRNTHTGPERIESNLDYLQGYEENSDQSVLSPYLAHSPELGAAGGLVSTLMDCSRWIVAQINGGKIKGKQVFPPAIVEETLVPAISVKGSYAFNYPEFQLPVFGIGRAIAMYRGHLFTYHFGSIDGHVSHFSLLPTDSLGIIAFANRGDALHLTSVLTYAIYDRLLNLPPLDWNSRLRADHQKIKQAWKERTNDVEKKRVSGTTPAHSLGDYTGQFTHPAYGAVELTEKSGQLVLNYHSYELPLQHYHYESFQSASLPPFGKLFVRFATNRSGQVPNVHILFPFEGQEVEFSRLTENSISK